MRTERFNATVTDNVDPRKRGRIKVKCLELLGDDTEHPAFINPCFDWGWFFVPDVGEEIEIEATVSDDQEEDAYGQAFLEAPNLRWRGKRFVAENGEAPRPPHSQLTETNYGKRRGFGTPTGHVLLFDDTEGGETVTLSWKRGGAEEYAFISLDKDGSVILSNTKGGCLYLNAADGENSLIDEHGNSFSSRADSMNMIDIFNNSIELKDKVVTVLGAVDALLTAGGNVMVEGGSDASLTAGRDVLIAAVNKIVCDPTVMMEVGGGADFLLQATQMLVWIGQAATAFGLIDTQLKTLGQAGIVVPAAAPLPTTKLKST